MEPRNTTKVHDPEDHVEARHIGDLAQTLSCWMERRPGAQSGHWLELVNDARKWEALRCRLRDLNAALLDPQFSHDAIGSWSCGFEYWLEADAEIEVLLRGGSFDRPPADQEHLYSTSSYDIETGRHEPETRIAWIPLTG